MKSVTIYTAEYCPYCQKAKNLLKAQKIQFQEVDVTKDQDKRDELVKKTGCSTVPLIFIGDQFIGGCDDLHTLRASGQLAKLLED